MLGASIDEQLSSLPYDQRLVRLAARGIALWDVVGEARRAAALTVPSGRTPNRLVGYVATHPRLRAVAFNGQNRLETGADGSRRAERLQLIDLPSSSPAYTGLRNQAGDMVEAGSACMAQRSCHIGLMTDDTIEDDEDQR